MKINRDHRSDCRFKLAESTISIGRFTYGVEGLNVRRASEGAPLAIGRFCSLATPLTIFLGGDHRRDWATTFPFGWVFQEDLGSTKYAGHPFSRGGVTIGNDVWTGADVTIMAGVTIGDGAIIAANSHVVRHVASYDVVGGNPARKLRSRFEPEVVEGLLKLRWWDLPVEQIRELAPLISSAPTAETLAEMLRVYRPG